MKKGWIFLIVIGFLPPSLLAQNVVHSFQVGETNREVRISLGVQGNCQFEIIPFDSKRYTLVKFAPLQFAPGVKDAAEDKVRQSSVPVQALELTEPAVMLALKGVLAKEVSVRRSPEGYEVRIEKPGAISTGKRQRVQKDPESYYSQALDHYMKKNFERALSYIHRALALKPRYPEAYFLAGKIRFERGEWRKARINFQKALSMDSRVGDATPFLSVIQEKLSEPTARKEGEPSVATDIGDSTAMKPSTQSADSLPPDSVVTTPDSLSVAHQPVDSAGASQQVEIPAEVAAGSDGTRMIIQIILFLLIVSLSFGWPILLILKRHELTKIKAGGEKKEHPGGVVAGTRFLDELEKRFAKAAPNKTDALNFSPRSHERSNLEEVAENPLPGSRSPFAWLRSRTSVPHTPETDLEQSILRLASQGFSVEEIAEQLRIGRMEVQVVLNLKGKKVPAKSPHLRIEFVE